MALQVQNRLANTSESWSCTTMFAEPYILDLFFNFLPCRVSLHFLLLLPLSHDQDSHGQDPQEPHLALVGPTLAGS